MTEKSTAKQGSQTAKTHPPTDNIPTYSVGEINASVRRQLESHFGRLRVRGEITDLRRAATQHLYFNLKDETASLAAVCWRGKANRLEIKPEDGLEVIAQGLISTYAERSLYQLIVDSIELAGEGALLKMLEQRRQKLAAQGWFDDSRKRPLPFLPKTIGVITSPVGAALRDIYQRIDDRFPCHLLLWPVAVQGDSAAAEITQALIGFNNLAPERRPDLLILARGGGSLDDLMAFNDEKLVEAIAKSAIPIITGIGHETDHTLAEYAADWRASTPTAAAEKAVPLRRELRATIGELKQRQQAAITLRCKRSKEKLALLARMLKKPQELLNSRHQRLNHAAKTLQRTIAALYRRAQQALIQAHAVLRPARLQHISDHQQQKLKTLAARSQTALNTRYQKCQLRLNALPTPARSHRHLSAHANHHQRKLENIGRLLATLSFENTLERGFVLVKDPKGRLITQSQKLQPGQKFRLLFANKKEVAARALRTKSATAPTAPTALEDSQSNLFDS